MESSAKIVQHVTVPRGTALAPGVAFVKTWTVTNDGAAPWGPCCFLVFESGKLMSQAPSIALPSIMPREEINISLELVSPKDGGPVTSTWRLLNGEGLKFGEPLVVEIVVLAQHAEDTNIARDALAALIRVGQQLGLANLPEPFRPPAVDGPSAFPYLEELWHVAKQLEVAVCDRPVAPAAAARSADTDAGTAGEAADADGEVTIHIRFASGGQLMTMRVSPYHTIADIKAALSSQVGAQPGRIVLTPGFTAVSASTRSELAPLDNGLCLADYHITDNTMLDLRIL